MFTFPRTVYESSLFPRFCQCLPLSSWLSVWCMKNGIFLSHFLFPWWLMMSFHKLTYRLWKIRIRPGMKSFPNHALLHHPHPNYPRQNLACRECSELEMCKLIKPIQTGSVLQHLKEKLSFLLDKVKVKQGRKGQGQYLLIRVVRAGRSQRSGCLGNSGKLLIRFPYMAHNQGLCLELLPWGRNGDGWEEEGHQLSPCWRLGWFPVSQTHPATIGQYLRSFSPDRKPPCTTE